MLHRLAAIGLALWIPGALLVHLVDALAADILGGALVAIGLSLELLATALIVLHRLTGDPPTSDAYAHHTSVARTDHTNRRPAPGA